MSNFPIVAQLKSAVQAISGDSDGARETQLKFLKTFIGFSQIFSLVQSIKGDNQGARQTQKECLKTLGSMVDGISVAGHIKGVVHYEVFFSVIKLIYS